MLQSALPVAIQTMVMQEQGTTIYYPQVFGLPNSQAQQSINQAIFDMAHVLRQQQYNQQNTDAFTEMIGTFEIKTNQRHVLSLTLTNYAIAYQHANGLSLMASLTFDTHTGKSFSLQDLFKPGSHYTTVLSQNVQRQIDKRDIPLLHGFPGIAPNQMFYIADKALVLYFQPYEITPGYIGAPMFPVSVYDVQNLVEENGPFGRMAGTG
ncbi:hypothetical protein GCM10028778_05510 [Barrientosiimonas marina]|uniref:DUF3298 domain-containing protein n=1 Tax=Lentibacillus kimchii TaxID=1542911 RepID=A0ABW2UU98_9BACI